MTSRRLFDKIQGITISHVTKKYGSIYAVRDVSLDVIGGELLVLIGPSGSGKTTPLRMVNRLIEPDEGSISIDGQDIRGHDPVTLRRNMGYVIQQIGLFPHMSVRENIGLIPRLEGWPRDDINARVDELLSLVALPPEVFSKRYPQELSGGQQQRVGLARALAMDPPILLMDEPFGALDPILRMQLQDEFARVKGELGKTILFVTHDIEESFKLGDRIAIMRDASLDQVGTADELIFHPESAFVADIVDANKKYKHVDTMCVGDVAYALDDDYLLDGRMDGKDALSSMHENDIEVALAMEGGEIIGLVNALSLYRDAQGRLRDHAFEPLIFDANDSLSAALSEMKAHGISMAVVTSRDGQPTGMISMNETLLRLV
ncbi:MAG TPA: ATP-binding cassette domain-containing protein [Methanomicrobia archaeon]|nr:ATP-binding cassette domain-containing protein [Methanomicrobia archaeon]